MDPEQLRFEAAQRWEKLVAGGMSKEEAKSDTDQWLTHRQRAAELGAEGEALAGESQRLMDESKPNFLQGATLSATSGVTLGGADEMGAAIRSLPRLIPGGESFGDAYRRNVESARAGRAEFREDHPVVDTGLEIGGAVAPAIAAGPLVAGGKVGAGLGIGRIMAVGAGEGAVAGALESEGGLGERAGGAVKGGALGALFSGALTGVGRVAGRAGSQVLDIANLRPRANSGPIGQLGRRLGIQSVAQRADERIAGALPSGTALTDATQQLDATGRPLTMMDVDENVRGLARAARGVPGRAKTEIPAFLANRTAGQESRVIDDALRLTGVGDRASVFETTQDIMARRRSVAQPLYEAAYEHSVPRSVLGDIMSNPAFQDAYERGVRIAKLEGVDLKPIGEYLPGRAMRGEVEIPVQAIDYMKRGLDDAIESGMGSSRGMGRQEARGLRNQLRQLLERVDEAVPEYQRARAAFAGESRMLEALEQGKNLWNMDPAEARSVLQALPESEREMFVRGGLESMAARIEDTASSFDITRRRPLSDRTRDQQRLRLLFPDDTSFDEFRRVVAEEAQAAHGERFITGGSNTADKLMELAQMAGHDLSNLASGNVTGLLARALQSSVANRARGFSGDLAAEMIPTLTATGPRGAEQVRRLSALRSEVGQRLSRREAAAAGTAGALVGGATNRRDQDR